MKRLQLILAIILCTSSAQAATWYVDSSVSSSGNGQSWASAWKQPSNITSLSPGDTIYFSGGPDGGAGQTYTGIPNWKPTSGSAAGGEITFAVGQDAAHSGMVTFSGSGAFIRPDTVRYVTINGQVNGRRRMTITNYEHLCYSQDQADKHLRFLYLNVNGPTWFCYGGFYELAFSSLIAPLSTTDDSLIAHLGDGGTSGFGKNSIHHNYIEVPRKKTQGQGFDALKWVGNVDIYDNTLIAVYNPSYAGGQHNDGIQTAASFVRVYNNYFENFISYPIYHEMYGNTAHWRIYNNVIKAEEAGVDWTAYYCMALGFTQTGTISDYIVANNTCIGGSNRRGIALNTGIPGTIGSSVYLVNNLVFDSDTTVTWNGPGSPTAVSNNVGGTSGIAFVKNALYPSADFHLTNSATAAINQGISPSYLTSVFTYDKDNASRMQKSTWDIGAYSYATSSSAIVPPPAPENLRAF